LPVHALFPRPEVGSRFCHRDYLWLVDLVRAPIGDEGRRSLGKDVLQPIGALTVREGDQEVVIVLGRYDRGLVRATRSAPDMTDDRSAGPLLSG
jgi:hypothetical protein